ncbi:MAG TPA: carboxypeptidase regulatory-like domain-containing protein [Pyrinomonadaceae bacterium]|nr:carboxypeptidase regulatory-like domain-containing protein [Pyrinomonadaceae bacterium]
MKKKFGVPFMLLLLGVVLAGGVRAQTSTVGTISGTVRDPQGAAVRDAEVLIEEETTGQSRTVKTDEDGEYSAPSLPVGRYRVTVAPAGFKRTVAPGIELHVNDRLVVDITLEVGEVTETVTVTDAATLVETESGKVSSLVAEKQVTELPLNGRNYAALVTLVPGLSAPNEGNAFGTRGTGLDSHVDVSVNGNQSNANMWTVDGVNNMDVGSNATLLVFPSIDAIQEFRVERNSFSAEYGQAQGAVINLVTKGGGNEFHGTLFEFFRNDVLNANDFFSNRAGIKRAPLRYNNFGGNFNGPIVKDRVFFFWSEEWRRERRGTGPLTAKVPTAAERMGDFSGVLTQQRTIRVGDQDVVVPALPNRPGAGRCDTPGPNPTDPDCFPGNRIPADQLSPVGLALMNIFPLPNNPADPTGTNWISTPLQPVNTRQDLIRGDITITDKMNLMVRYINETWVHGEASGNFWGDSPFPTLSSDWEQPSRSFAVKLANTLTSTAVNEFQFSVSGNDIFITTSPGTQALNDQIASVFPTVFPQLPGTGFPTIGWGDGGYPTLWHQAPWENHQDLFIWKDDFSKVFGDHSAKFGVLFSHNVKDEQPNGGSGLYTIQSVGQRTGNAIAELLVRDLPLVQYTEFERHDTTFGRWRDFEFYGNDTWKVRNNLTLTLGVRYSYFPPAFAADDRMTNWVPELYDGANIASGFVRADQAEAAGLPRALVNGYKGGIQPRLGLAWDIRGDGKTAVRLGFGRYISRSNVIASLLRMANNPPWNTVVDTGWQAGAISLADCPNCRSLDTINPGLQNAAAGLGTVNSVDTNFKPPESWQWNLTVSREIMPNTVAEVSYVGNHGLHLWRLINGNYNQVLPQFRDAVAKKPDDLAKHPEWRRFGVGNTFTRDESTGDSNYHALQVWVDRRFSDRLSFQTAYTWAHAISNVPTQSFISQTTDVFNYDLDRGDSDLDRRHSFVFNAVYVLPSFRRFGTVGSKILGDWQLNTIASFYTGTPLNIFLGADRAGLGGASSQRPNLVEGVPLYADGGNPIQIINPDAFSPPALGTFGSLGRGVVRGPGVKNIDFSAAKNWRIRERFGLQFRAEMFNVFNFVNFRGHNQSVAPGGIENNFSNGGFGRANSTRGPREIQFGLKLNF